MYCLDTSAIISIFRGSEGIARKIKSINPEDVCFTVVSLCELYKGAYKATQKEKALRAIEDFCGNYRLLNLTTKSCETFGKDFNELNKTGKHTQELDLIIASIAKENGLVVVTRNKKHFENIPNLKVEEW